MSTILSKPPTLETEPPFELDASSNGTYMTVEEFMAVEHWDRRHRYELINGVVIVNPAVSMQEGDPNEELGYLLRRYAEDNPQGEVLSATASERDVRVGKNVRRADRGIWIGIEGDFDVNLVTPQIVIEFVSSGRRNRIRDYQAKRQEYLQAGVQEYWVIDRFSRTLTVFSAVPGQPAEQTIAEDAKYATPLLPGFELPLQRLLLKADKWKKMK